MGPGTTMEGPSSTILVFDGKVETYMVWKERFTTFLQLKGVEINQNDVHPDQLQSMSTKLYAMITMHVSNDVLQMISANDTRDGFDTMEFLDTSFGKLKKSQIFSNWSQSTGTKAHTRRRCHQVPIKIQSSLIQTDSRKTIG